MKTLTKGDILTPKLAPAILPLETRRNKDFIHTNTAMVWLLPPLLKFTPKVGGWCRLRKQDQKTSFPAGAKNFIPSSYEVVRSFLSFELLGLLHQLPQLIGR